MPVPHARWGKRKGFTPFALAKLRASRDLIIHHNKVEDLLTLLGVDSREQHAAALKSHHLARGQVDDGDERLADELFGLVPLVDAGEDLAVGAGAVVERKVQQLLGLLDGLACLDLHGAEVALGEGIKVDELLKQWLDGNLGIINRGLERLDEGAPLLRE